MRSARRTVDSRWATTTTDRPRISRSSAPSTTASVPGSRFDVASSSTSTAGSTSAARASDTSWRSPADSREPRSRTGGREPVRERLEPLEHTDRVERGPHVVVGRVRAGDAQVVGDRAVEQEALLGHDDDALAQRRERRVAQIDAAERDRPVVRVVQARHQLGHRRLAGAGRADERQTLAGTDARATRRRAPRPTCRDRRT